MDGTKFDALTKGLATGRTRRSVLRGLIGGGAAVVAVRAGTTLAGPADMVTICHFTGDPDNPYIIIEVSEKALPSHTEHGDFVYRGECCLDSECDDGNACNTDTCNAGVCSNVLSVDCSSLNDSCNVGVCDGSTGLCYPSPSNEGGACNADDSVCTDGDSCSSGDCSPGPALDCFADACNTAACDPILGCSSSPTNEGGSCDDGTGTCNEGACVPNPVACTDGQDFCTQTIEGNSCGNAARCYCVSNKVSGTFCGQTTPFDCGTYESCGIDGSCSEGKLCAIGFACCERPICLDLCD